MKVSDRHRYLQGHLQAFKKSVDRFRHPLSQLSIDLDAVDGLLHSFDLNLALLSFSPFPHFDSRSIHGAEPTVDELTTEGPAHLQNPDGSKFSNRHSEALRQPQHPPGNDRQKPSRDHVDFLNPSPPLPVFKVDPKMIHQKAEKMARKTPGQNALRRQAGPVSPESVERTPGGITASTSANTLSPPGASGTPEKGNHTGLDPAGDSAVPSPSDASSIWSALEKIGRMADDFLTRSTDGDLITADSTGSSRILWQRSPMSEPKTPASIKRTASVDRLDSRIRKSHRAIGADLARGAKIRSGFHMPGNLNSASDAISAESVIGRIEALSDRLLDKNRMTDMDDRKTKRQQSRLIIEDSGSLPTVENDAVIAAEERTALKPHDASIEVARGNRPNSERTFFNSLQLNSTGSLAASVTAEQMADLINDVLVDQARKHGVDLS